MSLIEQRTLWNTLNVLERIKHESDSLFEKIKYLADIDEEEYFEQRLDKSFESIGRIDRIIDDLNYVKKKIIENID